MSSSIDLSVLIVSYNCKGYLRDCLKSIYRSDTECLWEVIVVDNNSSDGSRTEVVKEFPEVKWIQNAFNYGFSVAMNQAFRLSKGRYVMSFNPDAEVFPDTIQCVIEYLDQHSHVGMVGMATLNSGIVSLPKTMFEKFDLPHLIKMYQKPKSVQRETPYRVDWIFGTGMVVRRSILPAERLYDEASFLFWEEFGLSERVKNAGYEMHILPYTKILHHASVTMKVNSEERIFWVRLLSLSHQWRIRKRYFGKPNAYLNFFIGVLDNALLYFALSLKSLLSANNPARELEKLDRKVQAKSHLRILIASERTIVGINDQAIRFFNGGRLPPYPPLTYDYFTDSK